MTDKDQATVIPLHRNLLRLREIIKRTGLSRSTIYARAKDGTFPKPVPLGNQLSGWIEDEIDAWVNERIRQRGEAQPLAA